MRAAQAVRMPCFFDWLHIKYGQKDVTIEQECCNQTALRNSPEKQAEYHAEVFARLNTVIDQINNDVAVGGLARTRQRVANAIAGNAGSIT
jgi:hypothetical protein